MSPREPLPSGALLACAILTLVVAVLSLNIPYFAISPGPAPNVFELIDIGGTKTKPVHGKMLLTTVSLHQIKIGELVRSWFDPSTAIYSRSMVIPSGQTEQDAQRETTQQMDDSQQHAAAAALTYLGYRVVAIPSGARVDDLSPKMPAEAVLRRGDVIVAADSKPVKKSTDLAALFKTHKVGDTVSLDVRRGKSALTVKIKTVPRVLPPHDPVIGVLLGDVQLQKLPLAVDIQSLGIGGPSAGLMYALGIVDLLDANDLAHGRTIAGTGAISAKGDVEPVGAVPQKLAAARSNGATFFLAPISELDEACAHAKDLKVVGVDKLSDAVNALNGEPVPASRLCH